MNAKIVDEIVKQIPKALLRERSEAAEKVKVFEARINDYRKAIEGNEKKAVEAELELSKVISAGGDASAAMRRVQDLRRETEGLSGLITRTGDEIERVQAGLDEIGEKISAALTRAVLERKIEEEARIKDRIAEIEMDIQGWREAVFAAASSLGCPLPSSGLDLVMKADMLRNHIL